MSISAHNRSKPLVCVHIPKLLKGRLWIVILVAAGLLAVVLYAMNTNRNYTVEFIVPNEYRGVIIIEEDEEHGADPVVYGSNTYVYTVPDSGTLLVKSFALFDRYHFEIARYANGREIPTLASGKSPPNVIDPGDVALYDVGTLVKGQENPQYILFVGTLSEFQSCQKELGLAR